MDFLISLLLKAWVFRRSSGTGKKKIKEQFFPSNCVFFFNGTFYKSNWVLSSINKTKQKKI